jgi:hypothetical protein
VCDAGFQQFGGNTTCFQITFTDINQIAIIDAGTGIRKLGRDLKLMGHKQEQIVPRFHAFPLGSHPRIPVLRPGLRVRSEDYLADDGGKPDGGEPPGDL